MASLANQTISSTYDGLVKTSTDQPVGVSGVQLLEDGVGNSLALSVGRANQGVTVTGPLTGTLSATSVLADGVIATTQATSDNSTKVATTAYVKSVVTAEDLDIAGDSGTGSVDLDSQTLTIAGTANEIETSASGQTITIGLPSTITANVTGNVTGNLTGTVLTAAQANITSVGTLSTLAVSGNLTVDTNTLFVDASSNEVGIRTSSPASELEVSNGNTSSNAAGPVITISNQSGAITAADISLGSINFESNDPSASGTGVGGAVKVFSERAFDGGPANTYMAFYSRTGSTLTERVRVPSTGGITFNGDTAAANALDDYEEGTWTVTMTPITSGTISLLSNLNAGNYTKVGRLVTVTGLIRIGSVASPVGNYVEMSLPFPIASQSMDFDSRIGGAISSDASGAAEYSLYNYRGSENQSYIIIILDASTLTANDNFTFSFSYTA